MIQLFEHPVSPYAQKVKIALYEKGIPFEATIPNLLGLEWMMRSGGESIVREGMAKKNVRFAIEVR
jgi:hypothetical protein